MCDIAGCSERGVPRRMLNIAICDDCLENEIPKCDCGGWLLDDSTKGGVTCTDCGRTDPY